MSKSECEDCEQLRDSGTSCNLEKISINGRTYARVPYLAFQGSPDCEDCGAPPGGIHHFPCGREKCPVCKASLIECEHTSAVVNSAEDDDAENDSSEMSVPVSIYVSAMKKALDKFEDEWDGDAFAKSQTLDQWNNSFIDFLEEQGGEDDET